MTNDALLVTMMLLASFQNTKSVPVPVIKAAWSVTVILKKQSNPSARWDSTANTWWIGESHEYQWTDEKTKEYSPWMNLDDALVWIKNRDQEKNLESKKVGS